jgi:hypothetical protein
VRGRGLGGEERGANGSDPEIEPATDNSEALEEILSMEASPTLKENEIA